MAVAIRPGFDKPGLMLRDSAGDGTDRRIDAVLVLTGDEVAALGNLLADVHPKESRMNYPNHPHYLAPNHHESLLTLRKAVFGY